jgi:hypothetical protein
MFPDQGFEGERMISCGKLEFVKSIAPLGILLFSFGAIAFEFEPGAGVGLEYTDNARLTADDPIDDTIVVGYVGAKLAQSEGPLIADITASLNHHRYTKDSYDDVRYFNLGATADWEMIQDRLDWYLSNFYNQRPIDTFDPNTPDNIQDSNAFALGANMALLISPRQTFTLMPEFRDFYYEDLVTDNQQYTLTLDWSYQRTSLDSIGLNGIVRVVDYDLQTISDVTFTSAYFALSGERARSEFSTNLGTTHVARENGQNTTGFAGNLDWLVNLTNRSNIRAYISTDLTDTSSESLSGIIDPGAGNPNDIQITTDVIRNNVATLGYTREDGTLVSTLTGELREVNYSETPNDNRIKALNAAFNYPVTALLTSGFYARFYNTDYIDADRTDKDYTIGAYLRYQLSRKLHSRLDAKYRNRDSTLDSLNFDEWSAYASLVYGFGEPLRPTRSGGF